MARGDFVLPLYTDLQLPNLVFVLFVLAIESSAMSSSRQYDIVVFGATGYTGKLTAEYITTHLPTDLRWALAGRSQSKLRVIAAECKTLNADRTPPGKRKDCPFVF